MDIHTQPISDETSSGSVTITSWNSGLLGEGGGGWSSAFIESSFPELGMLETATSRTSSHIPSKSKGYTEESSFDSILNLYTRQIHSSSSPYITPIGTPELSNIFAHVYTAKEISPKRVVKKAPVKISDANSEISEDDDFEIIPASLKEDSRTLILLDELGKIPREKGLDQQNFECAGCKCSIGMIFGPYNKCSLDGHLYCTECMGRGTKAEEHVIPARIVHDWDLRVHPVCSFNKRFLIRYEQEPLLDLRELNSVLYSVVPELASVQGLRRQLGFLRLYLFSCEESAREKLKRLLWPREHLYEHVHLYSTIDLLSVPSGSLQKILEKAVLFARKHVLSCQLCCQKGFICEMCNDPKVIFWKRYHLRVDV
ncbi:pleckstrin homology domain-containing family M member 1-like [Tropilaelaps mercedesae]|uniref:Pleckstrin homology domain-containing family M member 1-like n=1 Tax=Tropilaelaps mercedesae TaxID=418985 RepID=A0A1V9Y1L9_9ACAR|nr:pleckstrin homology domain-containing family M member 1-like [Tropilaelaps mercedesae]